MRNWAPMAILNLKTNNEIPQWMIDEVAAYDLEMTPAPGTVLDIGANIGAFALRCRARWPEATIRCYEPVAENYRSLMENVSAHPKIQAYRFAVRNFSGRDKILIGDQGVTCGFYRLGRQTNITERVMCVDAKELGGAELVKIDTEGCEIEILSRLNLRKTRALVVEYHRPEDAGLIKAMAVTAGFQLLDEKSGSDTSGVLKFCRQESGVACGEAITVRNRTNKTHETDGRRSAPSLPVSASREGGTEQRKIYVAVASHFSNHDLIFLQSMMQLVLWPPVPMSFGWSCDPSVERARNILTANFLASDCTHLLFIDADIAFSPEDVKRIASHNEDVVGGIYPLKTMESDVKWCGNGHCVTAIICDTASICNAATGCAGATKPDEVRPNGLQEVGCIGTGFMCIARRAFERFLEADGDKIRYAQDWPPYREEFAFWRQTVRNVNGKKRFLTEDWNFCYRYRELGGKIFADTRVILKHAGRAVWPLPFQQGNPFSNTMAAAPKNSSPSPPGEGVVTASRPPSAAKSMEDK
jgi:FkbM family methyltransferase